ncbi:MAG: hypothetical protein R2813_07995 [Flavobacteriales bacterium]
MPIEAFELVLIKQVGFSWGIAPIASRSLIIIEFAIGVSIMFGFQTRRMIYASLVMLAVFTVYLGILAFIGEGGENCGCFGELIPMDAPTSIAKNLIFASIAIVLLWKFEGINRWRFGWLGLVLAYFYIPFLFVASPLPEGKLNKVATLSVQVMSEVNQELNWDLMTGEKVVLVMYSKCVHCAQLASLISTTDLKLADEKLRMLIYGPDDAYDFFMRKTSTESLPSLQTSNRSLMQAINGTVPTVIALKDGQVISNWTGEEVNIDLLVNLLDGNLYPNRE